jgi:hypothetical protein
MSREIELLTEIRDLLLAMAEPAIAKRDQKFREALRRLAGNGKKNATAIVLMDGSRPQASIAKQANIDQGQLSRLVKSLAKESLIAADEKHPKLVIAVPKDFFETYE